MLFIYFFIILNFCFILILSQMATVVGPAGRLHHVYTISGVRVEFPAKAYPSQIAMMDKVRDICLYISFYGRGGSDLLMRKLLATLLGWWWGHLTNVSHTHDTIRYLLLTSIRNQRVKASGRRRGRKKKSPKNVCGVHLVDITNNLFIVGGDSRIAAWSALSTGESDQNTGLVLRQPGVAESGSR